MRKETRVIEEFFAEDDDGNDYEVEITQEFMERRHIASPFPEWVGGLKEARLDDGTPLNYIDADTYKVVTTGKIIKRVAEE